jgi:methionyl aminopeptidase
MIFLKSKSEIAIIKENGKILVEAFDRLAEIIKPGISTKDIDKVVEDIILSHSAMPSFKNYRGYPYAVCASVNAEVVHGIPSATRILQEGDIVGIDVGAFKNGFHADAARTYAVGNISAEAQRLMDVTKQSFFEGFAQAKIGNRVSDISAAVQQCAESAGFGVVRDLLGHGIGRSMHEDPNVPNYGAAGKGPKLRAGLVIAVEPMITQGDYRINTLADGWTTVTRDGKLSAHYENTIAITADGPVILTIKE